VERTLRALGEGDTTQQHGVFSVAVEKNATPCFWCS